MFGSNGDAGGVETSPGGRLLERLSVKGHLASIGVGSTPATEGAEALYGAGRR
jgi:hypothetical protein